ncbi:MAG: 3-deoxy-7-phosphoheptulonate synthase class II [Gammaproteobacteria bacterium]
MKDRNITNWYPTSWQGKTAGQQPLYADQAEVDRVLAQLSKMPPLVTWGEIESLKKQLAEAARGERFLLQGGDCAESFEDCRPDTIANKLKILLQMSVVLIHGMQKRVIRVGRIAGQYAKPRSADIEERDGKALPSYRGDLINRAPFTEKDRKPDPHLLLRGYERAAMTLNYVRAMGEGGFADLHHPEYWQLDFVKDSQLEKNYRHIIETIRESLSFAETVSGRKIQEAGRADFYTSHEGLHLLYEQAQTQYVEEVDRWYNNSTHFPWIGVRTAHPDAAHVEFFRGIANPVGVKIGPDTTADEISQLVDILNPDDEAGRLTLIHRYGYRQVEEKLPILIEAVRRTGKTVLYSCDSMHGNTEIASNGLKTRRFENILSELNIAFAVHKSEGSHLGGVHVELTGENVTECTGGARGLTDDDLERAYKSQVDPRLNYEQALEMAMQIAEK